MLNTLITKKKKVPTKKYSVFGRKFQLLLGKKIFLSLAIASLFSLAGCGNGKTDDAANANVPPGMVAVDLSGQGLPILVNVPDSTIGSLEITANSQGGVDVKVGNNFQMTIIEGAGNIELMKNNDITHDAVRNFVKYIVEEPNALVWEWQIGEMDPECHFYAVVKAGEKSFEVRNLDGVFSEKDATQMLDAAKSIRLKAPVKAES